MKITVAFNLRTKDTEEQAELLNQEDVDRLAEAIRELKHEVTLVEVSGRPNQVVEKLLESSPDLIFNVAEGTIGSSREAFYPGLYEQLQLPFTGGNASLLHLNQDKHLAKTVVAARGIAVPHGVLVTKPHTAIPKELIFPLIIKPNSEGSSKGITQDSIVETREQCLKRVEDMLKVYPSGLVVEEYIRGKELSVPFLEAFPGKFLGVVEHSFDLKKLGAKYNIYEYGMKHGSGDRAKAVKVQCPADISDEEAKRVLSVARQVFSFINCPDFGRIDVRLHENGTPYFIELNPLTSLNPDASLMRAAAVRHLSYRDVIRLIIRSASRRYRLAARPIRKSDSPLQVRPRPTIRELGLSVGRFAPGQFNAITDVKGVRVGHYTHIEDNVEIPGERGETCIRTGVTAIVPATGNVFERRLVAGGFILNGVGEMAGLTQVLEWGWMETPILLTNTMSVGKVHAGVVSYLSKIYPKLGTKTDVVIPIVGETDDSFLNDVRVGLNGVTQVVRALDSARGGFVEQGSVGAGTGMITCDFAGGIGTSSRVLMHEQGGYTLGVLVLSNFGHMRNLTVEGRVVGRELDEKYKDYLVRRTRSYGSIIVVIGTDAPLSSSQLNRIAKRAALGLGRVGSHAASVSGEIMIAFSTANRLPRVHEDPKKLLNLRFISDQHVNPLYEATIEATEEAVLNAIFCSHGMTGRENRMAPPVPHDLVLEFLRKGREIRPPH